MILKFIMRDAEGAVVSGTPTVTADGNALTPTGTSARWQVDAPLGTLVVATLTGALPLDVQMPLVDPTTLFLDADYTAPLDATATANAAATGADAALTAAGIATTFDVEGARDTVIDAVTAVQTIIEDDVPLGFVRVTSAVEGELLPGSLVYAYLSTDTAEEQPVADPVVVDANGAWHVDLPEDDAYVLVGKLSTHSTVRTEVTT